MTGKREVLLYLNSVVSIVEQMTSPESIKYRIVRVIHHVVCADGRQAVPLQIRSDSGFSFLLRSKIFYERGMPKDSPLSIFFQYVLVISFS